MARLAVWNVSKAVLAGAIFLTGLSGINGAAAQAQNLRLLAKYDISFLGVPVGRMKNSVTIAGDNYAISGGARTNSMVALVAGTTARFSSKGKFDAGQLIPAVFKVNYKTRKKTGQVKLNYSKGDISSVVASPKIKYKPGTVPVEKAHLQRVLDPVSSLLFPVKADDIGNGARVCNRTLPVFDGRARINLVFSYRSKSIARAKGFKGEVFRCSVRYVPVSGIRPKKRNIKFMKANRDMEISLARVGDTNLYALFSFNVRTDKGQAAGQAYYFAMQ